MNLPILTDEERDALDQAMVDGELEIGDAAGPKQKVEKHNLATEDSSLGVNVTSIDMINERFVRLFRLGMLETLRISPKINPEPARIVRFGDYLQGKRPPLAVNTLRISPWRGNSIIVIEPSMIFSALDSFFGGFGRGVGALPPGRLFTPTETRVIGMILEIIFESMHEAWSPLMELEFERVASEINPQFAQIADEDDLVVWTRFQPENPSEGGWDIVYPYASLKPLRDLLRNRVQAGDGDEQSDAIWREQFRESIFDAEVEICAQIGTFSVTPDQLQRAQPGDLFWFRHHEEARVSVAGIESFAATLGEMGGHVAIRIEGSLEEQEE